MVSVAVQTVFPPLLIALFETVAKIRENNNFIKSGAKQNYSCLNGECGKILFVKAVGKMYRPMIPQRWNSLY